VARSSCRRSRRLSRRQPLQSTWTPWSWPPSCPSRLRDHVFPIARGFVFRDSHSSRPGDQRAQCSAHVAKKMRAGFFTTPASAVSRRSMWLHPVSGRDPKPRWNDERFQARPRCLVAETPVAVVPCHLQGAFHALPPHRVLPRFRKIVLTIGEPLDFSGVTNDRPGWEQIAGQPKPPFGGWRRRGNSNASNLAEADSKAGTRQVNRPPENVSSGKLVSGLLGVFATLREISGRKSRKRRKDAKWLMVSGERLVAID